MFDCPSQAAELLTSSLSVILDQMAPIRTIQVRKKYVPWLSSTTKELIKQRDEAQAKAGESKCLEDWRAYKNFRNITTARVRTEKKIWEKLSLTVHNKTVTQFGAVSSLGSAGEIQDPHPSYL